MGPSSVPLITFGNSHTTAFHEHVTLLDGGLTTLWSSVRTFHFTLCHHNGLECACLNNWGNSRKQQYLLSFQNLNLDTAYDALHGLRKKYQKGRLVPWSSHHGHRTIPKEAFSSPNLLFFPCSRVVTSRFENLTHYLKDMVLT